MSPANYVTLCGTLDVEHRQPGYNYPPSRTTNQIAGDNLNSLLSTALGIWITVIRLLSMAL